LLTLLRLLSAHHPVRHHLCGLAGVYMINCKAGEGAMGEEEEILGAYIWDHTVLTINCTSFFLTIMTS